MNAKQVGLAGAAAMVVGAFLPWVKATAPLIGTITRSGVEGGDGWFFVVLGAIAGALAAKGAARSGVFIVGALAGAGAVFEIADASSKIDEINSEYATASVGVGLWLILAGAVAVLAAGFIAKQEPVDVEPLVALEDGIL